MTAAQHHAGCQTMFGGHCTCGDYRLRAVEPPKRPALAERLLTRGDLADLPKPKPLIADTIDQRTVSVLAGPWGSCKSFIAQDWAACIASGKKWQGRTVCPGRVLYVAAEGAYGLHGRFEAWEVGWNKGTPIPDGRLTVLPAPVNLLRDDEVAELAELAKGVDLLVIDTLARCLVGADENSARDMGLAVDALYRLRDATGNGGTVLAVHHTGKDRTTIRGSSALEAGVDTVYQVEGDTRNLRLHRTKRKDGPREDVHQLRLNDVPGTDSAVISRLVDVGVTGAEAEVLDHFRAHFSATGASRKTLADSIDMPTTSFYRALNRLIRDGVLVNTGTDKQPFYRLADQDDES